MWVGQERRFRCEWDGEIGTGPSNRAPGMGRKLEFRQSRAEPSPVSLVTEGTVEEDSVNQSGDPESRTFRFGLCHVGPTSYCSAPHSYLS